MGSPVIESDGKRRSSIFSISLAVFVSQVGCLTLAIILAALFLGMWLDKFFNTDPVLTFVLIILSIPVSLIAIIWIVKKTTSKIQKENLFNSPLSTQENQKSE